MIKFIETAYEIHLSGLHIGDINLTNLGWEYELHNGKTGLRENDQKSIDEFVAKLNIRDTTTCGQWLFNITEDEK